MKREDVKIGMAVKTDYGEGTVCDVTSKSVTVDIGGVELLLDTCRIDPLIAPYTSLSTILTEALDRASKGKGKDRHANGKPFDEQPIVMLNLSLGSQDGCLFQIQKKCAEASRFYAAGERERAENELLDCIVYAAGAVITGRKR